MLLSTFHVQWRGSLAATNSEPSSPIVYMSIACGYGVAQLGKLWYAVFARNTNYKKLARMHVVFSF